MNNPSVYPKVIARFYDAIYSRLRDNQDTRFFLEQALQSKGKVLEIGSGTGRLFCEALKLGVDIYGLDVSPEMLAVLKSKIPETERHRIFFSDASNVQLDHKFNLIIAPFRVFQHFLTIDKQLAALSNIYQHLDSGGTFIFDTYIPNLGLIQNGIENHMDFNGTQQNGRKLQRIVWAKTDMVTQINHGKMRFVYEDENGNEKQEDWNFKLRIFFRYELELLIRLSKFKIENIYGDYAKGGITNISTDYVVVCKKD